MTDKELLFMAYGAMKAYGPSTGGKELLEIIEKHLFGDKPSPPPEQPKQEQK